MPVYHFTIHAKRGTSTTTGRSNSLPTSTPTYSDCKRWFVRGGSRKRVSNPAHRNDLKTKYIPSHPGLWSEEMPLP